MKKTLFSIFLFQFIFFVSGSGLSSALSSWNPAVSCQPVLTTISAIAGNQFNSTNGGALQSGGTFGGVPDKRSLNPPCFVTAPSGSSAPTFVEIDNVKIITTPIDEDCSTLFENGTSYPRNQSQCDTTQNMLDLNETIICDANNTIPKKCIHTEIDRDWKGAGYCGQGTACDSILIKQISNQPIDIQGFVYWDPAHTTEAWHSFSGWEIHPFTAWRISGTNTTPQASKDITVGTVFYPWYGNIAFGAWKHWQEAGNNPPLTWSSNYLPDKDPTQFNPSTELYDSSDVSTVYWQLGLMKKAGIQFSISSWWAPLSDSDNVFNTILNDYMKRKDNPYPSLQWTIYYEKEGYQDTPMVDIINDLQYITTRYCKDNPNFFKINGNCVIFVYNLGDSASKVSKWNLVRSYLGNVYIVFNVFSGYQNYETQLDGWHQYNPTIRFQQFQTYSAYVSPGFWKYGQGPLLERNLTAFDNALSQMDSANVRFKLIETWNEIHEGTQVEPAQEIYNNSGTFAAAKPSYGTSFIDALNKHFGKLTDFFRIYGTMKDLNNNSISGEINVLKQSNVVYSRLTDSSGNYNFDVSPDSYDIEYIPQSFYIQNYFIKLPSLNVSSDSGDIVSRIGWNQSTHQVKFLLNFTGSQIVESYSPVEPSRITMNGTVLTKASSMITLSDNSWFYDSSSKIAYMKIRS